MARLGSAARVPDDLDYLHGNQFLLDKLSDAASSFG